MLLNSTSASAKLCFASSNPYENIDLTSILLAPSALTTFTATRLLFPVDIRSSIITTFLPLTSAPSICFPAPCSFGLFRIYASGFFIFAAMNAAHGIPAVATPAITSTSLSIRLIYPSTITSHASGNPRITLLSQYIGLFIPEAKVNGSDTFIFTAFVSNNIFAISTL